MKKKAFVKKDINMDDGIILNNFQKEFLTSLIDKIEKGNLIVLSTKGSYIAIQKLEGYYEMDIISNDGDNKWQIMKHDNYSLRVTLCAIYQSPDIMNTKFYEYKYSTEKYDRDIYMKIIEALIKRTKNTKVG